ncbi:MAG: BON domain-containing protein [Terriglobales bacterium]
MRTRILTAFLALPLLVSLWAQAQTTPAVPSTPAATNNTALTGAIMQRLISDPILQGTAVTVAVSDNGDVQLNGVVARQDVLDRALEVVKSVPGVQQVTSNILVNTDPFAPPRPPLPSPPPPINATPPPLQAASSPQAQIARAFSTALSLVRVGVQVQEGTVLLYGSVETQQSKRQAESIAHQIEPKLPIKNIIWVNPHPLSPPPLIPQ